MEGHVVAPDVAAVGDAACAGGPPCEALSALLVSSKRFNQSIIPSTCRSRRGSVAPRDHDFPLARLLSPGDVDNEVP
eukprot:7919801-Pyramimonas_sp.AAC.1